MSAKFPRIRQRWVWISLVVGLVGIGVFLRLWNRAGAMYFMNDQGLLLLTTNAVVSDHFTPSVGPPISVRGLYLPPYMYQLVALFFRFGNSPLAVGLGYVMLNVVAGLLLYWYACRVYDRRTGIFVLGLVMFSASMVENGRSIWQAHPTFFFVSLYLAATEYAFRAKRIWAYLTGLFVYALSCALYPAPLLLLPYVLARAGVQFRGLGNKFKRHSYLRALLVLAGVMSVVFLPWLVRVRPLWDGMKEALSQSVSGGRTASDMVALSYAYLRTLFQDIFRAYAWLPAGAVTKLAVIIGLVGIWQTTGRKQPIRLRQPEWVLPVLFFLPALAGFPMPAYRMLPFYPFIFVGLGRVLRVWIYRKKTAPRIVACSIVAVFMIGNIASWTRTTITYPRLEYPRTKHLSDMIVQDMQSRNLSAEDVGVHVSTPLDGYDYYASPLYYLLQVSTGYRMPFTKLGNDIDRQAAEIHGTVYLVCDGFAAGTRISACINPFRTRFPGYEPGAVIPVGGNTEIVVFDHLST